MARIIWAPQAFADLEAIGDLIAREAPRYAQMLVDEIIASVDHLELFPKLGRTVPEIGVESIREIIYRGYRVIYVLSGEQADEEVEILTVIHSSLPLGGAEPA